MTTPVPIGPSGPTVRRLVVGAQLRRLREAKGMTREAAGYAIRGSESKISRLELGRVSFKKRDITDLLKLYGLPEDDERAESLVRLAEEANQPGWWHRYDEAITKWFETYLGLEEAANYIRTYENQFIPGLLQTEDYARAVVSIGMQRAPGEDIEPKVRLRMERQRILERPDPPVIWAVIDEAALRRPMSGRLVMKAQIRHLLDLMKRPNITVQVVPFRQGGHAAESGAFTMLRFEEKDLPDVVYLEQLVSALYLDKREHVDRYAEVMVRLAGESPTPEASEELLSKILEQA